MCNESVIEVEVLPANEGDCFLITINNENIHILIDGGTAETYRYYLKRRLLQLRSEGKVIDLLIVTHIDNDHIGGIIELLKENGSDIDSKIIRIKNIWHNSYRHLQFEKKGVLGKSEKSILNRIIANGETYLNSSLSQNSPISAMQGTTLAGLILQGGYCWNEQFDGKAVVNKEISYLFGKECLISVLKPDFVDLENLGIEWKKDLRKSRFMFSFSEDDLFDDAFEYYCRFLQKDVDGCNEMISYKNCYIDAMTIEDIAREPIKEDTSITNRSSIVVAISYENKKLLFLADNITTNITDWFSKENRKYSLVKLPHHGSSQNISDEFIKNIESDTYIISTNSKKYNHPDVETLSKIACKRTDYVKKIYFNYKIDKIVNFEEKICGMNDIEFVYLREGQKIYL